MEAIDIVVTIAYIIIYFHEGSTTCGGYAGFGEAEKVGYGTDCDAICVRSSGLGEAFEGWMIERVIRRLRRAQIAS